MTMTEDNLDARIAELEALVSELQPFRDLVESLALVRCVESPQKGGRRRPRCTHRERCVGCKARELLGPAVVPHAHVDDSGAAAVAPPTPPAEGEWTPESWNTCMTLRCLGPVEGPGGSVEFFDGSEARCIECKRRYVVHIAEWQTPWLTPAEPPKRRA